MGDTIRIGHVTVAPGERRRVEVPVARLPTETWLSLPVEVVNGAHAGPAIWLSAAVHGDEINGIEIIRRVLERIRVETLHGILLAVPIVNVFGFVQQSRTVPDGRDLNRAFPGSARGSLASRLAHLFMHEVVAHCGYGIDFHTGSNHRTNLPQIRANLEDVETRRCVEAFGAPVMMHSQERDGSLRQAATARGVHVLLYEVGEPLRFDPVGIRRGVNGTLRMMAELAMVPPSYAPHPATSIEVHKSAWVRARRGGILRLDVKLGEKVRALQRVGAIADAFGDNRLAVTAPTDGIVIGHTNNPVLHQGDGILHLAQQVEER